MASMWRLCNVPGKVGGTRLISETMPTPFDLIQLVDFSIDCFTGEDNTMGKILNILVAAAFASGLAAVGTPAFAKKEPAKTKMGCIKGKEKWNASAGKCEKAKPVKKAKKKKKK